MSDEANNPWREAAENGFETPHEEPNEKKKSALGCVLWGCLIVVVVGVVLAIAAGVGGYYLVRGQINRYTEPDPMPLPVVQLSDEELAALKGRVEAFREAGDEPRAAGDEAPTDAAAAPLQLTLTADDLNALIAANPDLKGRVHVVIDEGLVSGEISIPTDFIPMMGGRYFNATAAFDVSFDDGDLDVRLNNATVKGEPVPDQFLEALRNENLAEDSKDDPSFAAMLERIESLRVERDRIVLTAKQASAADPDGNSEPAPSTEAQP